MAWLTPWKFTIPALPASHEVQMPAGSTLLHAAATSAGVIEVWALCDPARPPVTRTLHVLYTGGMRDDLTPDRHVATCRSVNGLVYHLFADPE